jgi:hypothetical protein
MSGTALDHSHREVVAMTARAFWDDPRFNFFSRDLLDEYRRLPAVFRAYLDDLSGADADHPCGASVVNREAEPRD